MATCPSILAARFAYCWCLIRFVFVVRSSYSGERKQNQGQGLVNRKVVKAPNNFIAGRPKAALLFWFFSDLRCCVPLFIIILVIYKYKYM